jgi:hypothetical protein
MCKVMHLTFQPILVVSKCRREYVSSSINTIGSQVGPTICCDSRKTLVGITDHRNSATPCNIRIVVPNLRKTSSTIMIECPVSIGAAT